MLRKLRGFYACGSTRILFLGLLGAMILFPNVRAYTNFYYSATVRANNFTQDEFRSLQEEVLAKRDQIRIYYSVIGDRLPFTLRQRWLKIESRLSQVEEALQHTERALLDGDLSSARGHLASANNLYRLFAPEFDWATMVYEVFSSLPETSKIFSVNPANMIAYAIIVVLELALVAGRVIKLGGPRTVIVNGLIGLVIAFLYIPGTDLYVLGGLQDSAVYLWLLTALLIVIILTTFGFIWHHTAVSGNSPGVEQGIRPRHDVWYKVSCSVLLLAWGLMQLPPILVYGFFLRGRPVSLIAEGPGEAAIISWLTPVLHFLVMLGSLKSVFDIKRVNPPISS